MTIEEYESFGIAGAGRKKNWMENIKVYKNFIEVTYIFNHLEFLDLFDRPYFPKFDEFKNYFEGARSIELDDLEGFFNEHIESPYRIECTSKNRYVTLNLDEEPIPRPIRECRFIFYYDKNHENYKRFLRELVIPSLQNI
ncbi:hypothetical protein Bp8pS_293 [Bacillus phage vB_BpuM-BpSp]|nr:hypothetical protein Bp8pS_293 [Bacillus phage vB_BpuM-BpSp]